MRMRAQDFTLADVAQWCADSAVDPIDAVSRLLGEQGTDVVGFLVPAGAEGVEDTLQIA